jgi:hypothetical protein
MNICGIEISDNALCKIKNWPYGPDTSVVARLFVFNGGYPKIIFITELSSDLGEKGEEKLLTEEFSVRLLEKPGADQEDGIFAEISSGKFEGTLIFIKFKRENPKEMPK